MTETSLALTPIQMGARVYLPTLGRFTSVDPVPGGTANNYVYVLDPINSSDYTGQFSLGGAWNWAKKHVAVVVAVVVVVVCIIVAVVQPETIPAVMSVAARAAAAISGGAQAVSRGGSAATSAGAKIAPAATNGVARVEEALPAAKISPITSVPARAQQVLSAIDKTGVSPYRSAQFMNDGRGGGQILPRAVNYTEHDIYELISPGTRGAERIVTGDDDSAWYTADHYMTFLRMR